MTRSERQLPRVLRFTYTYIVGLEMNSSNAVETFINFNINFISNCLTCVALLSESHMMMLKVAGVFEVE